MSERKERAPTTQRAKTIRAVASLAVTIAVALLTKGKIRRRF